MNKKFYIFALLLIASSSAFAQSSRLSNKNRNNSSALVKQYEDSLLVYRQKLQLAMAGNDSLQNELNFQKSKSATAPVLTPLTFYHGVVARVFGLNNLNLGQAYADNALMNMYVNHPEYVADTEKNLSAAGGIAFKPTEPLKHEVDMTSQVEEAPQPVEAPAPDAPVELVTSKPNFWKFAGDYSLQFLQNYISDNWYKGGESNYSMIGAVTLQANYNDKEKIKWDNKLEMKLGMQSSQGDTLHNYKASEDLIRFTSKLGIQATKRWYYTLQGIVSTQFTHGYKANDHTVYSDFMSPFNANLSLGMDYKLEWFKKHLTGTVNISPLAANFKYVDRLSLATRNGIDEGLHSKWDLGSTFTADLVWKFSDLVKWQTRLYAFSSYHRMEVEWENTLSFQLSKYISTKVFIYPRFDDSAKTYDEKLGYFQLKEYWSLGFNYSF